MDVSSDIIRKQILDHLKTIPIFDQLEHAEIEKLYGICTFKEHEADDVLCRFGEPSNDLFILLDGRLVARTKTGVDVAYISPIGVVGEMGVLTDQPRSADVVVFENAMGFEITKKNLIQLFVANGDICRKILLNVVKILSSKLYDANIEVEKLRADTTRPDASADNIFLY